MRATARGENSACARFIRAATSRAQHLACLRLAEHRRDQLEVLLLEHAVGKRRVRIADARGLQPLLALAARADRDARLRACAGNAASSSGSTRGLDFLHAALRVAGSASRSRFKSREAHAAMRQRGRDDVFEREASLRRRARRSRSARPRAPPCRSRPRSARCPPACTCMRFFSSSAPSIAAKVWPQHAWFLNVMRVMWKSLPRVARPFPSRGLSPIAAAKPTITSSDPVTPSRAASAAVDARLAPRGRRAAAWTSSPCGTPAAGRRRRSSPWRAHARTACGPSFERLGRRRRGAEAADGAGVVPVLVVRLAHRRADAGGDLVADHDRPAASSVSARAAAMVGAPGW